MTQRIAYPDNPIMAIAWRDFISFALTKEDFIAEFTKATGIKLPPAPANGLEKMIDDATGVNKQFAEAFIAYANEHWWDEDPFAPEAGVWVPVPPGAPND